jgi:hypothetical protein
MEVTKMRQWLTEFKTLVTNSVFELQIVEGILYPYLNVQDETKYLKYINGDEFGNISSGIGNFLFIRYTENPIRYEGRMALVDLVLCAGLPYCKNVDDFSNLIVQRLQSNLVLEGAMEVQKNMIEVFKTEISDDQTKMKEEFPMFTVAFTLRVPQSNIICRLDDLVCGCPETMIMSC